MELNIKQMSDKFGCCEETILKLLKTYNLKTQRQIQIEMIADITKEQIIDAQINSRNIKDCCKKLGGIGYST